MSQPVALAYDTFSDDQLASRVRNFLQSRPLSLRSKLRVLADSGVVTLQGQVATFYQKQLCIHGAQRVAGVQRVVDELDVLPARTK